MDRRQIAVWEQAERSRSATEAVQTERHRFRRSAGQIERYRNPPAETAYPLEYAYHLLGDVSARIVVDFGCGSGENSLVLAARGARVYGFDVSEPLIHLAAERLAVNGFGGRGRFFVSSAHDLPLPDESVDVVFGIAILHHLDLPAVSREVHRVLRPGGRAIFQEPVRNSKVLARLRALVPWQDAGVSPFERPLTDGELEAFGRGFSAGRARSFLLPHVGAARLVPSLRDHRLLYRIDRAVLRRLPALGRFASVRVFELTR
jgi:SAM-dependent methyltransferase